VNLSPDEAHLFFELLGALLGVVNRRQHILPAFDSPDAVRALRSEQRLELRDALYQHPECFDDLLASGDLPSDLAEVVAGWRDHRVSGQFYLLRHLKRHTIFLSTDHPALAYGVVGLVDPLELLVPHAPALVGATLLPFRGRIVYDGFLTGPGVAIHFGGGIRRTLEDSYREAKAAFGVITSLPHDLARSTEAPDEVAKRRLKALVRSQRSRQLNWEEIEGLRARSPELERAYHQERGKAAARSVGRSLRKAGVEQGWFALYEGLIVASAGTRKGLVRQVREVLPARKRDLPYLYQLKRKR